MAILNIESWEYAKCPHCGEYANLELHECPPRMTLKTIAAMPIEELRDLKRDLIYSRAWSGSVGHIWYGSRATLCGKWLVPHDWRGSYASKSCTTCSQRVNAINARLKEANDAQR